MNIELTLIFVLQDIFINVQLIMILELQSLFKIFFVGLKAQVTWNGFVDCQVVYKEVSQFLSRSGCNNLSQASGVATV